MVQNTSNREIAASCSSSIKIFIY